jgi:hypothetical protein
LFCSPVLEALSGRTLIPTDKVSLSVPPRGPAIPSLRPQNSGILPLKTWFLDANPLFRGIPLFDNRSQWKIASPRRNIRLKLSLLKPFIMPHTTGA